MLGLLALLILPLFLLFLRFVLWAMYAEGILSDGLALGVPLPIMRLFEMFGPFRVSFVVSLLMLALIVGLFVSLVRSLR